MSGRRVLGGAMVATVFACLTIAYGITLGWALALSAIAAGIILGVILVAGLRLIMDG